MNFAQAKDPIPGAGMDAERRPGVPMETAPTPVGNAHWIEPERQAAPDVPVLKSANKDALTPVFSTAIPPRGLSGVIRRAAYRIPDHKMTHWALLLLGDRVDVLEHRVQRAAPIALPLLALGGVALALRHLRR